MSDFIYSFHPSSIYENFKKNENNSLVISWISEKIGKIIQSPISFIKEETVVNLSNKKRFLKDLIFSYKDLPDNWNGNGAVSISCNIIKRAITLLSEIEFIPEIFPTARNTVQFEFDKNDNYLEIEIFSDYYNIYQEINGVEKEYRETVVMKIEDVIERFYGSVRNK